MLSHRDPILAQFLQNELARQRNGLEMIASENYTSEAVLEAAGSVLTNKYAEGYPGKRYYGGNEWIDEIEKLAIDRAKKLFGCAYANVQPHAGSQANMAVYLALLQPGDTILSLKLDHGGHLTHGHPVNFSGKLFKFSFYSASPKTGRIDMEEVRKIALELKPKMILAGASAYSREWDFPAFRAIADEIGALFMVDMAHIAGLVAAGVHSNPIPHAHVVTSTTHKTLRGPRGGLILSNDKDIASKIDKAIFPGLQGGPLEHIIAGKAVCFAEAMTDEFKQYSKQILLNTQILCNILREHDFTLVSGGSDNHLILIDLANKNLSGKQAQDALDVAGIHTNKNAVPFDSRPPQDPGGLRIGTPALTTRGMKEKEMEQVGHWIVRVLENIDDTNIHAEVKKEVEKMTEKFPLYEGVKYI
ncbi:MAG: glycine hydroxymethyltransferase [Parcubacteria group bacterium Gr01-1014_18]|nr:MAG: glycine hydroxymethyltransferase [Parcubacteria group bacterium Greene0416_36]TSC81361.1 MAG: glycine hydroxymethyltransferase [Parcubacteria group bacterium Gr01-1014_18]TSC99453.1 MAG: glycine hydroxymethyltransferase [Parcubacteria group bacterium Greene1014_20]TSD07628.1 MAG: glycine hydroxymethyltransferase [Parcubacteria group bacterium Greene0714_2]